MPLHRLDCTATIASRFTPDKHNRLTPAVAAGALALGLTAASTMGVDSTYFSRYRDLGSVDEDQHSKFTQQNQLKNPPRCGAGAVSVETNGYAAGRGWGWTAWQSAEGVEIKQFPKNATGLHIVALDVVTEPTEPPSAGLGACLAPPVGSTLRQRCVERFDLYKKTDLESERFQLWVCIRVGDCLLKMHPR